MEKTIKELLTELECYETKLESYYDDLDNGGEADEQLEMDYVDIEYEFIERMRKEMRLIQKEGLADPRVDMDKVINLTKDTGAGFKKLKQLARELA